MDAKITVYVFVRDKDRFIVIKSSKTGLWGLPGGHLEAGESLEDCAHREVVEEVGVSIKDLIFLGVTEHIKSSTHYLMFWCEARLRSGEITNKEPDRASEVKWVSEIPQPTFGPLKKYLDGAVIL